MIKTPPFGGVFFAPVLGDEKCSLYLFFVMGYAACMRPLLFIVFICLSVSLSAAPKVYKKVNPDGSVEYSDIPYDAEAEPIKLKPLQSITLPPIPKTSPGNATPAPAKAFKYESINILSPKDDEGIRSNNGDFTARGELTPTLQREQEHHIQWLLDGKEVPGANSLTLSLKNLDRGTHQLQLRVVNFDGKVEIETATISFHILRVALGGGSPSVAPAAP